MYYTICQIICLVDIIICFVMFIGYWLSTDYYINTNENIKGWLYGVNLTIIVFVVINTAASFIAEKVELGIKASLYFSGSVVLNFAVIYSFILVHKYFQISRLYFANKRNRQL